MAWRPFAVATAAVTLGTLLAWGPAGAQTTTTDAGGRSVSIADSSRIISVGGDVTEILYQLGVGDRIVAVDTTSQYPPEALATKKSVGYLRALSTEGVLSVNGSLIIASDKAGPPEVVKALKGSSLPYVEIKDDTTPGGIAAKIRLVSLAVGLQGKGDEMVRSLQERFAQVDALRSRVGKSRRVLFVLNVQGGRAMVAGRGTSADAVIRLAGGENAVASVEGFKPIGEEALVESQPDVILTMISTGSNHNVDELISMASVQATPAGRDKRLVRMEPLFLLGFGPRTPDAARELMLKLYPDVKPEATSN
jgi:iron complex transport system substrate-binding protein